MYPHLTVAVNVSKETKQLTVLNIEGFNKDSIFDLCGHITNPKENAVYLCHRFLNLPNYQEMDRLIEQHKNITQHS